MGVLPAKCFLGGDDDDLARLHGRMPVILEDANGLAGRGDSNHLALMRPAENGVVKLWPVSRAVNSVRNNGAKLLDCIHDQRAP